MTTDLTNENMQNGLSYDVMCRLCPTDATFNCEDDVKVPFHRAILVQRSRLVHKLLSMNPQLVRFAVPIHSNSILSALNIVYGSLHLYKFDLDPIAYRALEFFDVAYHLLEEFRYIEQTMQPDHHGKRHIDTLRQWIADDISPSLIRVKANHLGEGTRVDMVNDMSIDDFIFAISLMVNSCQKDDLVMARYYATAAKSGPVDVERLALEQYSTKYGPMVSTCKLNFPPLGCLCTAIRRYILAEITSGQSGADIFSPVLVDGTWKGIRFNMDMGKNSREDTFALSQDDVDKIKLHGRIPIKSSSRYEKL